MPVVSPYWYADAILNSELPSPARQLALTICAKADNDTSQVRQDISLSKLERWTGLSRPTVRKHLTILETADWLVRDRPTVEAARLRWETTAYGLQIPAEALVAAEARAGRSLELGKEVPQAGKGATPGLGKQKTRSRASGSLSSISKNSQSRAPARCALGATIANDGWCCPDHEIPMTPAVSAVSL